VRRALGEFAMLVVRERDVDRVDRLALETSLVPDRRRLVGRRGHLGFEPLHERRGRLGPERQPFDPSLKPIERRDGSFAASGGIRKLVLRAASIREKPLEARLRSVPRQGGGGPPLLDFGASLA